MKTTDEKRAEWQELIRDYTESGKRRGLHFGCDVVEASLDDADRCAELEVEITRLRADVARSCRSAYIRRSRADNIREIDPDYARLVSEHFWDLV